MHLIDDEIAPRAGGRGWGAEVIDLDDRLGDEGGAVGLVFRLAIDARVEDGGIELERTVQPRGVGVDEELRDIETKALRGIEFAMRAEPVARAGADVGDMGVENVAGAAGQANAGGLAVRLVVEREENRFGAGGGDGDVDAALDDANAERFGPAEADGKGFRARAQVITDGAVRPVKCVIPAISLESAMRSPSAAAVSMCWRAGSGSKRSI